MKKFLQFIVMTLLFISVSSCITLKREKKPAYPEIIKEKVYIHDTLYVVKDVIYRDTVVKWQVKKEVVTKYIPIPVDEGFISDTVRGETNLAIAKAWINQAKLKLLIQNKEQEISYKIDSAVRIEKEKVKHLQMREEVKVREVKYIPGIYRWSMWFSVIVVITLIAYVTKKIRGR